jgi:hypothetical protein
MTDWQHKDEWRRSGRSFCVVVSRHSTGASAIDRDRGPNAWAVYAYIYPAHPRFDRIEVDSMDTDGIDDLPLHCGCTFSRWHRNADSITAKQIGADYRHLYDEHYTHLATREEAGSVFADAEKLFEMLKAEEVSP